MPSVRQKYTMRLHEIQTATSFFRKSLKRNHRTRPIWSYLRLTDWRWSKALEPLSNEKRSPPSGCVPLALLCEAERIDKEWGRLKKKKKKKSERRTSANSSTKKYVSPRSNRRWKQRGTKIRARIALALGALSICVITLAAPGLWDCRDRRSGRRIRWRRRWSWTTSSPFDNRCCCRHRRRDKRSPRKSPRRSWPDPRRNFPSLLGTGRN